MVFTDDSIPFAAGKTQLLEANLTQCSSVKVLNKQDIPLRDAGTRTPQAFSSLVSSLADEWTYSLAINDLYFDNAATPLRAAGKTGSGPPNNVGAGDGPGAAFQRIAEAVQAATVPEPLNEQGWQIIDEFNRSFAVAGKAASGCVAPGARHRRPERRHHELVGSAKRVPGLLQEDLGQVTPALPPPPGAP